MVRGVTVMAVLFSLGVEEFGSEFQGLESLEILEGLGD